MKAAVLTGPDTWRINEVPDPRLEAGQALVRTDISAICGSDLHAAHGAEGVQAPGYPGHESVGTVIASETGEFAPGQRVLCVPGAAIARGFAELQVVSASSAVGLPDGAPADLVTAQQLGTAVFAMKRFWPAALGGGAGHTAAVLGAGPAGLAFVRLLRAAGFEVVLASDTSPTRLAMAAALGARATALVPGQDALPIAMERTGGRGVDLVVEAAGKDASRAQAMRMVALDGRIGLFGLEEHAGMSPYPLAEVFRRRPTIDMVWGAQDEPGLSSFRTAVELSTGSAQPPSLLSDQLPVDDIADAFALAADPARGALKVAVTFG